MDIFTPRQWQIWQLMLERRTHGEIARELSIATQTVRNHMVDMWDRICINAYGEDLLQVLLERGK